VEEGQAPGANNAIRELGGVFGVGRARLDLRFNEGMTAAVWVGATVVAAAALAALTIPTRRLPGGVAPLAGRGT
jgi:hypothetical protein